MFARELAASSEFSGLKALYISLLGFPAIGLQMRSRRILPHVERALERARESNPEATLCDAGCGRGAFCFDLATRYPEALVTGLEYEPDLIDSCKDTSKALGLGNTTFLRWDIRDELEGGPWDVVVNIETLEHIDDHEKAAANLFQAVKPGGRLICHVPSYWSVIFGWKRVNIDVPGHVRPGYHGEELVELLEGVGFEVEHWESTYGPIETWCQRFSYIVTGAAMKRAGLYALLYPFLLVLALAGQLTHPGRDGTNVLAVARRPEES